jgi:hypothetical protein
MSLDNSQPLPSQVAVAEPLVSVPSEPDQFNLDALLIHAWLGQLLVEAKAIYADKRNPKHLAVQTGQAQRGFLHVFGNPTDQNLHHLLQSLHRFTECDDPLAGLLLRALVSVSAEHESSGDFLGSRAPDFTDRPRGAALWMRESLERWCDWIDAAIHLQTHAQWHLAPESFDPATPINGLEAKPGGLRRLFQTSEPGNDDSRKAQPGRARRLADLPAWQILPQAKLSRPQRPWPHPEMDETIISLWPLVRRHNWTFTDLLNVLGDLLSRKDECPRENERNLTTYCTSTLRLRKTGHGKTAKLDRPAGYTVALRLFPPIAPRPVFAFGEPSPDAPPADENAGSPESQLELWKTTEPITNGPAV